MIGYKFPTTARSQYICIYYNILYKFLCVFINIFYQQLLLFYFFFENQRPWLHYDNMTQSSQFECVCDSFSGTLRNDFTQFSKGRGHKTLGHRIGATTSRLFKQPMYLQDTSKLFIISICSYVFASVSRCHHTVSRKYDYITFRYIDQIIYTLVLISHKNSSNTFHRMHNSM